MKIKLIYPRLSAPLRGTNVKYSLVPPQSLSMLAAVTPPEHEVVIHDENHRPLDYEEPADLVGVTVYISSAPRAYEIAAEYRRRGVPVVLGGLHVTALPEEGLAHADAVVVGEAEETWPRLLRDLAQGRLQRFYRAEQVPSLDGLPTPPRDLVDPAGYLSVNALVASRGCPHRCTFCYKSTFFGNTYRTRPVDEVVREIEGLEGKHVVFLDDNLTGSRRYARELFRRLIPLGITWHGAGSLNAVEDEELVALAAESGCRTWFIGFESIYPPSLAEACKVQNHQDRYADYVERLHRYGIMVNASFVFGFDHDDEAVFERTVRWGVEHCLDTATFHILTPYPGTPTFQQLEAEGRIIDRDWGHYDTAHVVFQPRCMSPETLQQGYLWAYQEFYRWPVILRRCAFDWQGFLPRLLMNAGYKKVESLWAFLVPRMRVRWAFHLFLFTLRAPLLRPRRAAFVPEPLALHPTLAGL